MTNKSRRTHNHKNTPTTHSQTRTNVQYAHTYIYSPVTFLSTNAWSWQVDNLNIFNIKSQKIFQPANIHIEYTGICDDSFIYFIIVDFFHNQDFNCFWLFSDRHTRVFMTNHFSSNVQFRNWKIAFDIKINYMFLSLRHQWKESCRHLKIKNVYSWTPNKLKFLVSCVSVERKNICPSLYVVYLFKSLNTCVFLVNNMLHFSAPTPSCRLLFNY